MGDPVEVVVNKEVWGERQWSDAANVFIRL